MMKPPPTPMMAASLLYKLHGHGQRPGVSVDPNRFREVYTSRYNKVRIYKVMNVSEKSKKWLADPANRLCDAPGSWYCPGQYPPAIAKFTGIIKPAYNMPEFAKRQMEEKAKAEAKSAGELGGEKKGEAEGEAAEAAPKKKKKSKKAKKAEEL